MNDPVRSPEDHARAAAAMIPPIPVEQVPAAGAIGRRLARDVPAPGPLPAFDNSQMDGYALGKEHLGGGAFPLGPVIAAGADPAALYPEGLSGAIAPIMTGAALPRGAAAVVPVEACEPGYFDDGATAAIVPAAPRGQFIRRRGSDIGPGDLLFPKGHRVNARTVGAAALAGIEHLPVRRQARVLLCTGGEEIGGAGPAQIPDANAPMLRALCARHGIDVAGHISTADDPARLGRALVSAVADLAPDVVVTSGGISHGRFEVVRQVLEPLGGWFGHVAQQPGGPQGLAELPTEAGSTPVICLPGNPVSTMVSFRLFVAPLLGEAEEAFEAVAGEDLVGIAGRENFVRGVVEKREGRLVATATGGRGSHLLAQAVDANALLRVPAGRTVKAGDTVKAYSL
ncbi:molybdopterin molybdotransferase MoeA [Corynebacterium liangguodongii]|uniref:Molybdopterin molybdenumtransferase n=1 Tax=Corynebacterium liangguodongii TaxID=2079535 RepID=A0A2S0WDR5_9CORY|nr:molybdopterin molybdotransferase MoeA [Corynebacterium liangguodongii]AWB83918.1 molybdopterin molybdenumtransferase MoeA [Corynebacterium liangguodongii]PWB99057.1 molybdopterin molybdenumtransferase MoeA [Corynebacterium liangguodongii]